MQLYVDPSSVAVNRYKHQQRQRTGHIAPRMRYIAWLVGRAANSDIRVTLCKMLMHFYVSYEIFMGMRPFQHCTFISEANFTSCLHKTQHHCHQFHILNQQQNAASTSTNETRLLFTLLFSTTLHTTQTVHALCRLNVVNVPCKPYTITHSVTHAIRRNICTER